MKNPQLFQQAKQMMINSNPNDILKSTIGNYTPNQMQQFINYAKGFGISEEQLKQYGINLKS